MVATNGNPEVLAQVAAKMGIGTDHLQQTLQALQTGNMSSVPPEVLQQAQMKLQQQQQQQQQSSGVSAPTNMMTAPGVGGHQHHHHHHLPSSVSSGGLLDDEQGQNWLTMYRGVYMRHADIAYGPIFTTFVFLLFHLGALPLAVALPLLPLLMIAGVRVILIGAAGIPNSVLPFSRLPAGMIASWEVAAEATFLLCMLPYLQDKWLLCFVQVGLTSVAYYLHFRAFKSEPGFLEQGAPPPPVPPEQLSAMQASSPYHCLTCGIYKPIRSKHCSVCGRCVAEFYHHCPVIANCVGVGNRREFAGYLMALFAAELMWARLAAVFWSRQVSQAASIYPDSNVLILVWKVAAAAPGTAYMSLLVAAILSGTGFLALRQVFNIVANMTTNEVIGRRKYAHFKSPATGAFFNPFDQGVGQNCVLFWQEERPSWYEMYAERKDGDDGGVVVPWSASRLFLQADLVAEALREKREKKQREREEWILAKYGSGGGGGDVEKQQLCSTSGCSRRHH